MSRNLWLLLGIALLFGISTGIYEFVLPYYLDAHRVSFSQMGWIFTLAGLAMVVARIYMGGLADRWGRKRLYGWALVVCGGATALAAPLPALLWQLVLKTLRETAALTRETIYPIILYEEEREGFLNRIGKFRGLEYFFQAGGTLLAGIIITCIVRQGGTNMAAYQDGLYLAGAVLVLAGLLCAAFFHEHRSSRAQRPISVRELCNFDLHRNLQLLAIAGFIFTFGMQLSHSFYLPLFFAKRFSQPGSVVFIVMVIHRVTIALPMFILGNLPIKNLRRWYIIGMLLEGITLSASAVIPVFLPAAIVFLLHDFIGSGIWSPIQAALIQRYSRNATRGIEVGKVLAWSSLGGIAGPLVAGIMATHSPVYPFFFSGLFMVLSAIPLLLLNTHAPAPDEQSVAQPATA